MNSWLRCIIWLVLNGTIYKIANDNTAKNIALAIYIFSLLYYLHKRGMLKDYKVAVPRIQKISRGSVTSLTALGSVMLMNLLVSLSSGNYNFSLGICLEMLYTAFMEELFFRGYLITVFFNECNNQMKSILGSGALFGLLHTVNLLRGGDVVYTIFQSGCAVGIGILLGILATIFESILPGVIIHWLINISAMEVRTLNIKEYSIYLVVVFAGVILCLKEYSGGNKR